MEASTFAIVKDAVTIGLATLGAGLGVYNTWRAIKKDRPRLRIEFKHAIPVGAANPRVGFCIDILNLGTFPITVTEVGVLYEGTDQRGAIINPIIIDGRGWPRRLESRSSVTAYIDRSAFEGRPFPLKCAYARTECGLTFENRSGAFKQVAQRL